MGNEGMKKASAFFAAVVFTLSSLAPVHAAPASVVSPAAVPALRQTSKAIDIPSETAVIRRSHLTGGEAPVILVEDAHAVSDAQRSIASLLSFLDTRYGLSFVGVEGASGVLDPVFFQAFPEKEIFSRVMNQYLDEGELPGAVFSAMRLETVSFEGVEERGLYDRNIDAYLSGLADREKTLSELAALEDRLNRFKKKHYSPELFELDRRNLAWLEKNDFMGLLSWLAESRLVKEKGSLSDMPELASLLSYIPSADQKSPQVMSGEIRSLAAQVRALLKGREEAGFNGKLQAYETGLEEPLEFVLYLSAAAAAHGKPLALSDELRGRLRVYETVRSTEGEKIIAQLGALVSRLKADFTAEPGVREADRLTRDFYLAKKLVRIELSRAEWRELKALSAGEASGKVQELAEVRAALRPYLDPRSPRSASCYGFYEAAASREKAMIERLKAKLPAENGRLEVLVAGGFHTDGFAEELDRAGKSWMLVSPRIASVPDGERYRAQMTGQVSWNKYFQVSGGKVSVSRAFRRAAAERLYEALVSENGEISARIAMKKWRDAVLESLAARGRIGEAARFTGALDEILLRGLDGGRRKDLEEKWSKRVRSFTGELVKLHEAGRLTPEALVRLFQKPAAAAWSTSMILTEDTVPGNWNRAEASRAASVSPARAASSRTVQAGKPSFGLLETAAGSLAAQIPGAAARIGQGIQSVVSSLPHFFEPAAAGPAGAAGQFAASIFPPPQEPLRSEIRPPSPPAASGQFEMPDLPHLRFAINLKDIGAYITEDGKLDYRNSLRHAIELLPILKQKGIGRVYLYNGLYEMSQTGRDVHRGRNIDRIRETLMEQRGMPADFAHREAARAANGDMLVWGLGDRAVSFVNDYPTKETVLTDPETGREIRITDDYNPFSILSLFLFNPKLSESETEPGSAVKTRMLLIEFNEKAHELGIKVTVDFIPWLSPDSIDESNYRWTFHKELGEAENEKFRSLDEPGKKAFMEEIAKRDKWYFPVRITEEVEGRGVIERLVLVQHLITDYGDSPNIDQVILNPHLKEVQDYYVHAFDLLAALEVDEVRVDLAHYYLNQYIRDHEDHYQHIQTEDKPEPWQQIIARVKEKAAEHYRETGREGTIEINTEAYNQYVDPLLRNGVDRSYYDDVFKALVDVARGAPASELAGKLYHVIGNRGKLVAFLSNFDHFRLEHVGGAQKAAQAIMLFLAYVGADVMWDMNDWLGLSGHLFPMVGGNPDPGNPDHHPFAKEKGLALLTDFEKLKTALEAAPADQVRRDFFAGLGTGRETWLEKVQNGKEWKYITWAWRTGPHDWYIVAFDMKPWINDPLDWVHLPRKALSEAINDPDKRTTFSAVDARTGKEVTLNTEHHHIEKVAIPAEHEYSVIHVTRSEVRADSGGVWGRGDAALVDLDGISYRPVPPEMLTPVMQALEAKVARLTAKNKGRPAALAVMEHLRRLLSENKVLIFDERRWSEESYYAAEGTAGEIKMGEGYFADRDFAAQTLFRLAALSLTRAGGDRVEARTLSDLFGKNADYQARHDQFVLLTDDLFLQDAVRRFRYYRPGEAYFRTPDLFQHWVEHEERYAREGRTKVPDPVTAQSGYLLKALIAKGYHRLPPAEINDQEEEMRRNPFAFDAYFSIVYPHLAFVRYQLNFFNELGSIKQSLLGEVTKVVELMDQQLGRTGPISAFTGKLPFVKHPDGREIYYVLNARTSNDLPKRVLALLIEARKRSVGVTGFYMSDSARVASVANQVFNEMWDHNWMKLVLDDDFVIHSAIHDSPTPGNMKRLADETVEHMRTAFKAGERWYEEQRAAFPRPSDPRERRIPVAGLDQGMTVSDMMAIFRSGSGYTWQGYAPQYSHPKMNHSGAGLYSVDESGSMRRGNVAVMALDANPVGGIRDSNEQLFYHLQLGPSEHLTVQRRRKSVAAELVKWLNLGERQGTQDDKDLAFYARIRSNLSPKTEASSFYTPGGVDPGPWTDQVMKIAGIVDLAFWEAVPGQYDSIRHYLDDRAENPRLSSIFWYFTLEKHPQGLYAFLADNLKFQRDSNRLTPESARLLLDTIFALYWSGPPRENRATEAVWPIRRLLEHFYIHPDGISVLNRDQAMAFLRAGRQEGPLTRADFAAYVDAFLAADEDSRSMGPPGFLAPDRIVMERGIYLPVHDGPKAQVWPDDVRYDPEDFAAEHILYPSRYPWPGVTGKHGVWIGTYEDGLTIPGSHYKYVFSGERGVPNGTPLMLDVNPREMIILPSLSGILWPRFAVPLSEAQEEAPRQEAAPSPTWKKVLNFKTFTVTGLPERPSLELVSEPKAGILYKAPVGPDGFLYVNFAENPAAFYFPGFPPGAGRDIYLWMGDGGITFYGSDGERIGTVSLIDPSRGFSTEAPRAVNVRPALPFPVVGYIPTSLAEHSDLVTLTKQLAPLMRPASAAEGGKGYREIVVTNADEPNIGTDFLTRIAEGEPDQPAVERTYASVVLSRYYLTRPDEAEAELRRFLEQTDPIYEMRRALRELEALDRNGNIYAPDFAVPGLPGLVETEGLNLGEAGEIYRELRQKAENVIRRIVILRKLDTFRAAHKAELGDWGKEEKFREWARDLLQRQEDIDKAPDFFFRTKSWSTTEVAKLLDDEANYKKAADTQKRAFENFPGMGVARGGYFNVEKEKLVLTKIFRKDRTPYIFLRFRDGTVKTFDFLTGDLVDELERDHRQAKNDYEKQKEELTEAVAKLTREGGNLDLNLFIHDLEEFLNRLGRPSGEKEKNRLAETEVLKLKTQVLGKFTQLFPSIIKSEHPEINMAVIRLVLDYVAREGYENAAPRAKLLLETYTGSSADDLAYFLYFAFLESDAVFGLSPDAGREGFHERFTEFFEQVLMPAVKAYQKRYGAVDLLQAENFYGLLFRTLDKIRGAVRENAVSYMEDHALEASRGGVFSLKPGYLAYLREHPLADPEAAGTEPVAVPESVQTYFINKIFEERHEEQKQIPDEEVRQRSTYLTPYGGVNGIGASAFLVEYRGAGGQPADAFIFEAGTHLDAARTPPNFPKTAAEFSSPVKALVLSHVHRDHIGWAVPLLRNVFNNDLPVYVPRGTYDLLELTLKSFADREEEVDAESPGSKFTRAEVDEFMKHVVPLEPNKWYALSPKMKILFYGPVGHMHGAASLLVSTPDSTSFLSGDISVWPQGPVPGFRRLPPELAENIDTAQIESTNGMVEWRSEEEQEKLIVDSSVQALAKGGRVILPSFSLGRAPRIFTLLLGSFEALRRAATADVATGRQITPDLKIYVDGFAAAVLKVYLGAYPEFYGKYRDILRSNVVIIEGSQAERQRLRRQAMDRGGNQRTIVVASSGNGAYGESRNWIAAVANDPESVIIFNGSMDPQEAASRLLRAYREREETGRPVYYNFEGTTGVVEVRAKIVDARISAHIMGQETISEVLEPMTGLQSVLLDHGSPQRLRELAAEMRRRHPEWNPSVMFENVRYQGGLLTTTRGLERRREFFESLEAEPLYRSEVRENAPSHEPRVDTQAIYAGVLESLARGAAEGGESLGAPFVALVRAEGVRKVVEGLELEARAAEPYYVSLFAGIDGARQPLSSAVRPQADVGLERRGVRWTSKAVAGLEQRVRRYLDGNPGAHFNYSFAFRSAGVPELREEILRLLDVLAALQNDAAIGGRVHASIAVLASGGELRNPELRSFFASLGKSRIAKVIDVSNASKAASQLNRFMEKNSNSLVYGAEGFPVAQSYQERLVRSGLGERYAAPERYEFPVALMLAERLAEEPGEITAELLSRITDNITEIVHYDGAGLYITSAAAELTLHYEAEQLLGRMA